MSNTGEPEGGRYERSRQRARLMARVQSGDQDAYRELLEDIGPVVLGFIRRRVGDPDDVEDIYQETLISVHRARHTFHPSRALEPWLFAIARNAVAEHMRRRLARATWEVLVEAAPERAAGDESRGEVRLERVLQELPPAQREAFEMLKLEGMSVERAAARSGVTPGALRVRAHRAYKAIKALLGG